MTFLKIRKYLIFGIWYLVFGIWYIAEPTNVEATLNSCSASVSPNDPEANASGVDFTFNVTNTDSVDVLWFRIWRPESRVTLGGTGLGGWYKDYDTEHRTFRYYNDPLSPGETLNPVITADIGDMEGWYGPWYVEMSENVDGSNSVYCTGSLQMTVAEPGSGTDVNAPTISNVTISSIGSGTATVNWITDEPATSLVDYTSIPDEGVYPYQESDTTLKTSHSITITSGLASSTNYYYVIRSTDETGNTASTNENSFTTSEYIEPSAEVITQTVTVTVEATPLPAQTKTIIIRDTTAPSVAISTDILGNYERAPTINGVAQDAKGVFRVDYSTDGGRNWLPVDEVSDSQAAKVSFTFTPLGLLDGNYELKVRAIDTSNNAGFSETETLIIDRLPPRVGSTLLTIGPQPLQPTQSGLVYGLRGVSQRIMLSSVGGATTIDLMAEERGGERSLIENVSNVLGVSQQMYSLSKNNETGLWSGAINFNEPGLYSLVARAVDGAENKTERELQSVYVLPNGRVLIDEGVVADARVTVYVLNPNTNRYVVWDGKAFLQQNPQTTDPEGKYGLILPPGKYYLEVKKKGYRLLRTPIFNLDDHTPINTDFSLEKLSTLRLLGKEFYLPSWKKTLVSVVVNQPENLFVEEVSSLVGSELPFFIINQGDKPLYSSDLVGKPTVLSFLTTWSPLANAQMEVLGELKKNNGIRTVGVFEQETTSKVSLFMTRGGYETEVWADEDGELVEDFSIHTTPTHILLDSKGKVRDVVVGFMGKEEILKKLY